MDFQDNALQNEPIVLSDENGDQMALRFLDLIQHEEREYLVLQPLEGPYRDEAVILQLERGADGTEDGYADVEDPKTLRAVYEIFKEHYRGQFIFED